MQASSCVSFEMNIIGFLLIDFLSSSNEIDMTLVFELLLSGFLIKDVKVTRVLLISLCFDKLNQLKIIDCTALVHVVILFELLWCLRATTMHLDPFVLGAEQTQNRKPVNFWR